MNLKQLSDLTVKILKENPEFAEVEIMPDSEIFDDTVKIALSAGVLLILSEESYLSSGIKVFEL